MILKRSLQLERKQFLFVGMFRISAIGRLEYMSFVGCIKWQRGTMSVDKTGAAEVMVNFHDPEGLTNQMFSQGTC